MKSIILLFITVLSTSSFAIDTEIFSTKWSFDVDIDQISFRTSSKYSEAWVEVTLSDDSDWEETWYETHKVSVEGLTYDDNTKEVTFFDGVNKAVCATVSLKTRFRTRRYIKNTGNCIFKTKVVRETVNNGRYRTRQRNTKILLSIKDS